MFNRPLLHSYLNGIEYQGQWRVARSSPTPRGLTIPVSKTSGSLWSPCMIWNIKNSYLFSVRLWDELRWWRGEGRHLLSLGGGQAGELVHVHVHRLSGACNWDTHHSTLSLWDWANLLQRNITFFYQNSLHNTFCLLLVFTWWLC